MTRTCWPARTCPRSRSACSAVTAEIGHGGGLLEAQVRRHPRELVRFRRGVLGERSTARAEHRLARFEPRHVGADRLDDPGQLRTQSGDLRPAQPVAGGPEQVGQPSHDVPRAPVQAGRADAHEHLFITDIGHLHLAEAQDVSGAVTVADDRLHRLAPRRECRSCFRTRERPCGCAVHQFGSKPGATCRVPPWSAADDGLACARYQRTVCSTASASGVARRPSSVSAREASTMNGSSNS